MGRLAHPSIKVRGVGPRLSLRLSRRETERPMRRRPLQAAERQMQGSFLVIGRLPSFFCLLTSWGKSVGLYSRVYGHTIKAERIKTARNFCRIFSILQISLQKRCARVSPVGGAVSQGRCQTGGGGAGHFLFPEPQTKVRFRQTHN